MPRGKALTLVGLLLSAGCAHEPVRPDSNGFYPIRSRAIVCSFGRGDWNSTTTYDMRRQREWARYRASLMSLDGPVTFPP